MDSDQAKLVRHLAFNQGLTPWVALEAIRMILDPSYMFDSTLEVDMREEPDASNTPDRPANGSIYY